MLSKGVAEIAKTFIKDGMKLDDAVLAAYRLMDDVPTPAVSKVLARDTKFNPDPLNEPSLKFFSRQMNDPKQQGRYLQQEVDSVLGVATRPPSLYDAALLRRQALNQPELQDVTMLSKEQPENWDDLNSAGIPTELLEDLVSSTSFTADRLRQASARKYAMQQLGLLP